MLSLYWQTVGFFKHNSVWRHTENSFKGSPVSPECIDKLSRPILPILPYSFLQNEFICLLVTLTCPFIWGWYVVDNLWDIEYFLNRTSKARLQKWEPLSLIIARGAPKREMRFSLKILTTTRLSFIFVGTASTHLKHSLLQPKCIGCWTN